MPIKQQFIKLEPVVYKDWHAGDAVSATPRTNELRQRVWSNDLLESSDHKAFLTYGASSILDLGGNFWVQKRTYQESSTLGKDPLYFSTTSDPLWGGVRYFTSPAAYTQQISNASFPGVSHDAHALNILALPRLTAWAEELRGLTGLQSLAELLLEPPPSLIGLQSLQSRAGLAHRAGSEYLNVEFGWKPLVRDVRAAAAALRDEAKVLNDLLQRVNRKLRRRHSWPIDATTTVVNEGLKAPSPTMTTSHRKSGPRTKTTTTTSRKWLSATFEYHVPSDLLQSLDARGWYARANHLYGLRLTPDVLWQLAPWSWATDWFLNVGDLASWVSNVGSDGLVCTHAYMMEEREVAVQWDLEVDFDSHPGNTHLRQTFRTTSKWRQQVSPFTLGLRDGSLSAKQIAIGAAIGATRLR